MDNVTPIRRGDNSEIISISGIVELTKTVTENTEDIKRLKERTNEFEELKEEMSELKVSHTLAQTLTHQKLEQLALNDERIEESIKQNTSGTSTFRYTLWSALIILVGLMFGTLKFGLGITEKSQAALEKNLQKQINDSDKKHSDNYDKISTQIGELHNYIIHLNKPIQDSLK